MDLTYRMPKPYYDLLMRGSKDKETGVTIRGFQSEEKMIEWLNSCHIFKGKITSIVTY